MDSKKRTLEAIGIGLLLLLNSCGWERKAVFKSPNRGDELIIYQPYPINYWGLRVEVLADNRVLLDKNMGHDVFVNFYHVTWMPDSSSVALYASGGGQPVIEFAYNFGEKRQIPFNQMQSLIAEDIRKQYHLSKDEDPFNCHRCTLKFIREHPGQITH